MVFESFGEAEHKPPPPPPKKDIVRREITATSLQELDLNQELFLQYKVALFLLDDAQEDVEASPQQKAAALNSVNAVISSIAKLKTDLYNAERIKVIENTLISTLKQFPEVNEAFIKAYENNLKEANLGLT